MKALDFLVWLRGRCLVPTSKENAGLGPPSKSELRRWLKRGVVAVNGTRPKPGSKVEWPIEELVFFPDNRHSRTTILSPPLTAALARANIMN